MALGDLGGGLVAVGPIQAQVCRADSWGADKPFFSRVSHPATSGGVMTKLNPIYAFILFLGILVGQFLPPMMSSARADEKCFYDGELGPVAFDMGKPKVYSRSPLGSAERATIVELSWPGQGFGGFDRAIVVLPRLGPVWQVNVTGYSTQMQRFFCGWGDEVVNWAVEAHLPSHMQASRNKNGVEPATNEIPVLALNYEEGSVRIVVEGRTGVAEKALSMLDLSFHEGDVQSAQPLHLVWPE